MSIRLHLILMAFCFIASAFFSGTESGVLSVSPARLLHLVRNGLTSATILSKYIKDLQHFLATILVGNNLFNVMLSTLSARVAHLLFPGHHLDQMLWACLIAGMLLVFSEYLPKLFFTTRPLRRTLRVVWVFQSVERILWPLTQLVLLLTRWFVPRSGQTPEFLVTREYIQDVVSDPNDGSRLTTVERQMIHRVLALQSKTAQQIMTPLDQVIHTKEQASLQTCFRKVQESGYGRLPVFSEDGTRCVGIFTTLDVFTLNADIATAQVGAFMRPPLFVQADTKADDLLPLMRKSRQHMAIVRDGEQKVLGLITEENILGQLTSGLPITSATVTR